MRSSLRAPILSLVVAAVAVMAPASAFAQKKAPRGGAIVETKTDSGYEVWFPVDNLAAGGHDATGDVLKGGTHAVRPCLMRPRMQFVPEMLKSVENL